MDDSAARPYRELVEHHLRRQSEAQLQIASVGEIGLLPENMRAQRRFMGIRKGLFG